MFRYLYVYFCKSKPSSVFEALCQLQRRLRETCVVNDLFLPARHFSQHCRQVECVGVVKENALHYKKDALRLCVTLSLSPWGFSVFVGSLGVLYMCAVSVRQLCIVTRKIEVCFFLIVTPVIYLPHRSKKIAWDLAVCTSENIVGQWACDRSTS